MDRSVHETNPDIANRVACLSATFQGVFYAELDRAGAILGKLSFLHTIGEFKTCPLCERLQPNSNPSAVGPAVRGSRKRRLAFDRMLKGLAEDYADGTTAARDPELTLEALAEDLEVQLAHPRHLDRAVVGLGSNLVRRVFGCEPREAEPKSLVIDPT